MIAVNVLLDRNGYLGVDARRPMLGELSRKGGIVYAQPVNHQARLFLSYGWRSVTIAMMQKQKYGKEKGYVDVLRSTRF